MANKKPKKLMGFHFQPFSAKQLKVLNWWADDSPVKDRRMLIADGSIRAGKEQPIDAILYTPSGEKKMGDIKVGDYVIDRQGNPTKVIGVFPQGKKKVYRVEFDDGSSTECGAEHLWAYSTRECVTSGAETLFTSTLDKLRQDLRKFNFQDSNVELRYRFPVCEPVNFAEREVKIDPYTFGVCISNCEEISDSIKDDIEVYKINSVVIRRKFVAGIINSAKDVEYNRTIVYKNNNTFILETVVFILRSLGLYVKYFAGDEFCIIYPDKELADFLIQKNRELVEIDPHRPWKKLKSIKLAGKKECQCIYVENPEHLYLTDGFIVTHNTVAITLSFILYVMKNFNYQNAAIAGKQICPCIIEI